MTEPNIIQFLLINLVMVGGIVTILLVGTWWYAKDCKLHPEKHVNDFKVREGWKKRFGE